MLGTGRWAARSNLSHLSSGMLLTWFRRTVAVAAAASCAFCVLPVASHASWPPPDAAPVAEIGLATPTPIAGHQVAFWGSASRDDTSIAAYAWYCGDGGTSTSADPTHVVATAGPVTVTLIVTDTNNQTYQTSRTFTVLAAQPARPDFAVPATILAGHAAGFSG